MDIHLRPRTSSAPLLPSSNSVFKNIRRRLSVLGERGTKKRKVRNETATGSTEMPPKKEYNDEALPEGFDTPMEEPIAPLFNDPGAQPFDASQPNTHGLGKGLKRMLRRASSHLSLDLSSTRPKTMAGRDHELEIGAHRPKTAFDAANALGNNFSRLRITNQSEVSPPFPLYAPNRGPTPNTSSTSMDMPILPPSFGGGAAARASAKAENRRLSLIAPADSQLFVKPWDREIRDSMSAIGTQLSDSSSVDVQQVVSKFDPLEKLPLEVVYQIFPFLDAHSLVQAEQVSRAWYHAVDRLAWRAPFFRDWDRSPEIPTYPRTGTVGGYGIRKPKERVDWKKLYTLRKTIEYRWQNADFLLDTPQAKKTLVGHDDGVYCSQFDQNKIVTGSRDVSMRFWDLNSLECTGAVSQSIRTYGDEKTSFWSIDVDIRHHGSILCLQYDEDILITGSSDQSCIVWDLKNRCAPIQKLAYHSKGVLDVRFNDRFIMSSSKDMTMCLYDRQTFHLTARLEGHSKPVNAIQLRGNLAVSASGDGLIKMWNLDSATCIREFAPERAGRRQGLACVEFSEDGRYIWAGGNDRVIYQFDANTGELIRELKGHINLVRSLYLDDANKRLISGSYDMTVIVWNSETGESIMQFAGLMQSWCLSAKADYRHLVATSQDGTAVVIDFGAGLEGVEELSSVKHQRTSYNIPKWWDDIVTPRVQLEHH